ncbi:MAG: chromate efflux transporter [Betaproteobacteria bacterium]|nr:chromate efflux transporter [Betaproteobacteria bacterium]
MSIKSLPLSRWQAFVFWFKLGFISFGGPAGQIAIMHEELVVRKRWISEKRFLHALNYCMLLPGPEAQQLATYLGWLMHKTWGGIVAGVLFVWPSLCILTALSWVYIEWGEVTWVAGLFDGIKPAVTAIVLYSAQRIGARVLKNKLLWSIALVSFFLVFVFNTPFPWVVVSAAFMGFLGDRFAPQAFHLTHTHASTSVASGPALIDDHSDIPGHAQFQWPRLFRVILMGLLLWAVPMTGLSLWYGWDHTFTQMAWFFTKAALLTFGGAYAVLPYVYQGAVEQFGWVTAAQMMDGLALGETTPGPLIMVVAFVGFVGGYAKAVLGPEHLLWAGAVAAMLVTWFTFLPSFVFILAGGPFIESTRGHLALTAPLTAITAAVVGMIVQLALFFAFHTLWHSGLDGPLHWPAAAISLAAAVALFKYKIPVMHVIAACGLMGVVIKALSA